MHPFGIQGESKSVLTQDGDGFLAHFTFFMGAGVFGLRVRDSAVGKGSKSGSGAELDRRASAAILLFLVAGGGRGGTELCLIVQLDPCSD